MVVDVIIDRPMFSKHPKFNYVYPINYGYTLQKIAGDGQYQDVYILGESSPLEEYQGKLIAIIHRKNDVEDKWVVANTEFTKEQILFSRTIF